jgi:outer membrane protein assembly factor BamB
MRVVPGLALAGVLLLLTLVVTVAAQTAAKKRSRGQTDKRVLWTFDTRAPSFGSGAAADIDGDGKPEVVFGTYFGDEHVYALNGEDGSLKWKFKSRGGPIDTSILIHDLTGDQKPEIVFGDSARGVLFCLDGRGREKWTYQGPSGTDSPAAAADLDGDGRIEVVYGTMKVRGKDGRVVVLDGQSGQEKWSVSIPGHVQSEPALVDLNGDGVLDIIVTTWRGDNRVHALDGRRGEPLWTFDVGDSVYHGVSVFDFDRDRKPEVIVTDRAGTVRRLAGESGRVDWTGRVDGERPGMVFGPTTLVDVDGNGIPEIAVAGKNLHLVDGRTGKVRWKTNLPGDHSIHRGAVPCDVNGDGKPEIVFAKDCTVYAVAGRTGKIVWSHSVKIGDDPREFVKNVPLILDLDGDGRLDLFLVTGRADGRKHERKNNYGRAFALRLSSKRTRNAASWTTFRGSSRRLGTTVLPPSTPSKKRDAPKSGRRSL